MSANSDNMREKVINEIFQTEKKYNKDVTKINTIVNEELTKNINEGKFVINDSISAMISKIVQIKMISDTLMETFNNYFNSNDDNKFFGNCFKNFHKLLIIYFEYIRDFHENIPVFIKEKKKNKLFSAFLDECELKLGDTVDSYLIMPIQRPPRYQLLLRELMKYTNKETEEYNIIREAYDNISEEIANVDEKITVFDEAKKMAEIQSRCSELKVFKKGRRLYFDGDVSKFSRKREESRHLTLFSDMLLIGEIGITQNIKVNKLYKSGEYLILNVEDNPPFINAVDVKQEKKSFRCNFPTPQLKEEFYNGFKSMIEFNNLKIETLEMKGFSPVWIPDSMCKNCMVCLSKFTVVNRKHHCRFCGDCICKDCFKNKIPLPGISTKPKKVCSRCFNRIKELTGGDSSNKSN